MAPVNVIGKAVLNVTAACLLARFALFLRRHPRPQLRAGVHAAPRPSGRPSLTPDPRDNDASVRASRASCETPLYSAQEQL